MKQTILAISGKPGLFKLVSRGNNNLIVEALDSGLVHLDIEQVEFGLGIGFVETVVGHNHLGEFVHCFFHGLAFLVFRMQT